MKIEKGKLYYNNITKSVFKSELTERHLDSYDNWLSDKIAVHCQTKGDWDYVVSQGYELTSKFYGESNYSLHHRTWMCNHNNNNYHIITIEQLKQFYPQTQTEMTPTHFAISPEEYQEWQEYKNSKKKPLELVYCMQRNGLWHKDDYSRSEDKEFKKLHKVYYNGVDYDLITTYECVYLGHVK